jgi:hypothetical protein
VPAPYGTLAGLFPRSPDHFRILADKLRAICIGYLGSAALGRSGQGGQRGKGSSGNAMVAVPRAPEARRRVQDESVAAGSDARRNLKVRSVSRIAAKPTMTFTQVKVSFIPTLNATSADRDALPRRV